MSDERGTVSTYENGVDLVVQWNIDFFTLPKVDGTTYFSPEFYFGGERWWLRIAPYGSSRYGSSDHVDLRLCKWPSGRSIKQCFSLSLKTAEGEKYKEKFVTKNFDDENRVHRFIKFISRSELSRRKPGLLKESVLTVVCTMKNTTSAGSTSKSL